MFLNYENKITILDSGGYCNIYFKTKRSGGNDKQNKLKKMGDNAEFEASKLQGRCCYNV